MRIKIRDELNVDLPVNLRLLKPHMKLYAGFAAKIHDSKWYQSRKHKKEEQERIRCYQEDERLKDALLATLYRELINNNSLEERGDICNEVLLNIDSRYTKSLERIITHKDFVIYNIQRISENADIKRAFPDMGVVLRASKRVL